MNTPIVDGEMQEHPLILQYRFAIEDLYQSTWEFTDADRSKMRAIMRRIIALHEAITKIGARLNNEVQP